MTPPNIGTFHGLCFTPDMELLLVLFWGGFLWYIAVTPKEKMESTASQMDAIRALA